jgi:hypothetical protein
LRKPCVTPLNPRTLEQLPTTFASRVPCLASPFLLSNASRRESVYVAAGKPALQLADTRLSRALRPLTGRALLHTTS